MDENNVVFWSRVVTIIVVTLAFMSDLIFTNFAEGALTVGLMTSASEPVKENVKMVFGLLPIILLLLWISCLVVFQIRLEVAAFKSGEKVTSLAGNFQKCMRGKATFQLQEPISLQSFRLQSIVVGFCIVNIVYLIIVNAILTRDAPTSPMKNSLIVLTGITFVHPSALILGTPKLFQFSKRVLLTALKW